MPGGPTPAERYTRPLDRTPWMGHVPGAERPDSLWGNVKAVALGIAALVAVFAMSGGLR